VSPAGGKALFEPILQCVSRYTAIRLVIHVMYCARLIVGVNVSNATFNSLVQRYSNRDGVIEFDDYIQCIARLCSTFGTRPVVFTYLIVIHQQG